MTKIIKGTHEFDKEPTVNASAVLTAASVLNDLNNVSVASPSTNDILQWNGSAWVPGSVSGGYVKSGFVEITTDTTTTATAWGTTLLSVALTPASATNYFIINFSASGDQTTAADNKVQFRILMGPTGSETARRATYWYSDAPVYESSQAAIVYRAQVASAAAHTVKVEWRNVAADTARIRPVSSADYDHASLLVQEVTG